MKTADVGIIVNPATYTVEELLQELETKLTTKVSGKPFRKDDIYQYIRKKAIPYEYGGNVLEILNEEGYNKIKIIVTGKRRVHGY